MLPVFREKRHEVLCRLWLIVVLHQLPNCSAEEDAETVPWKRTGGKEDPPVLPLPAPGDSRWPAGKHCGKSTGSGWSSRKPHSLRGSNTSSGSTASLMDTAPGEDTLETLWPEKALLGKDKKQSTLYFHWERFYFLTASYKIIPV